MVVGVEQTTIYISENRDQVHPESPSNSEAMQKAIANNEIHPGQYGRPGGECIDVAFSKVLLTETARMSRTCFGQFDSDAASCFDRIIMPMALTCFASHGVDTNAIKMWNGMVS